MKLAEISQKLPRWTRTTAAWAAFLVILYLLVSWAGMERGLIDTEIWALYYAGQPLAEQFDAIKLDLVHPPLIYLVQRIWLAAFGQTDLVARLLPLAINLPSLILFTWLASKVTRYWRLASFLFSGTYLTQYSAVTAVRMYGLGVLLTLVAIIVWDWWRKSPSPYKLGVFILVMTLLVYTHYFGFLMLGAFVVVNWLFGARRWIFAAAATIPGILFLPWLLYILPVYQARGLETNLWWVALLLPQPYRGVGLLMYEYLGPLRMTRSWLLYSVPAAAFVHLLLLLGALRAARQFWPPHRQSHNRIRWIWITALLSAVPVVILYAFSMFYMPALAPRFLLCILPAYWLLMVLLGEIGGKIGQLTLFGIVLPWVFISAAISLWNPQSTSSLRQSAELIGKEMGAGDVVLCDGEGSNGIYWDLKHRLALPLRIEFVRPAQEQEMTALQKMGLAQSERLAVRPFRSIGDLDLSTAKRIWYFHWDEELAPDQIKALASIGFQTVNKVSRRPPYLTLLERDSPS